LVASARARADGNGPLDGKESDKRPAVGFSSLVLGMEGTDDVGVTNQELRVDFLEALRVAGFNSVGAEGVAFGRDRTDHVDYVLGGVVRELAFQRFPNYLNCRIGIQWELLDVARDKVVYSVMSRHGELYWGFDQVKGLGKALVMRTFASL